MPRRNREQSLSLEQLGITRQETTRIAFACGFCTRAAGKIQPADVLLQMCTESIKGTVSHNDIAARIEACSGVRVSRQAYWERFDESAVRLFQHVLASLIDAKSRANNPLTADLLKSDTYRRVLVQDSTVIQLPVRLYDVFSGAKNATHTVCNARIQCVYDLKAGTFLKFTIDPYRRNDLSVTLDIELEAGDLVLRDRGYFSVESVRQHRAAGAHCIFRYKHKTALFDPQTGASLDLLALLNRHGSLDMRVLMGGTEKLPVRLIAAPVDEETANLRRMRARKEMKGHDPSREVLELMAWSIFLTTLDDPALGFQQILALYGLRWRIETIFKTWKSHFHFDHIHRVSEPQLRILLTARFIMMTVLYQSAFRPFARLVHATSNRTLSLMKFMRYLIRNLSRLPEFLSCPGPDCPALPAVVSYCTYDHRRRPHFALQAERILSCVDKLTPLA